MRPNYTNERGATNEIVKHLRDSGYLTIPTQAYRNVNNSIYPESRHFHLPEYPFIWED